jgi:hypothetical protein
MFCLRSLDISLEQDADRLLDDVMDTSLGVLINLVQADIVLAVAGIRELRHDDRRFNL